MRRNLMRGKLRLHHVTGLPAELDRVHVLYGAVARLASNYHIEGGHAGEKDGHSPPCGFAVLNDGETRGDAPFRQHDSDGDERQAGEKNNRDEDKNQQSNVRIVHAPTNVRG
jgi:hypothetical protein